MLRSGNEHGLHSPFVFKLYTEAISKDFKSPIFDKLEKKRNEFLLNHEQIQIQDFGAGSAYLKSNNRKISDIARKGISGANKCRLLYRIVDHLKPSSALEMGTSLGISTSYIYSALSDADLVSIEADKELYKIAKAHLPKEIRLINKTFSEAFLELFEENFQPDLVFIDGDHKGENLKTYINQILENRSKDCVFIIDDIYWSRDMAKAWNSLTEDPGFGISIDLFHFGLLFTRQKQAKQHFVLRT